MSKPMVRCFRAEKCRNHQPCIARKSHNRMGVDGYACQCTVWHVCRKTGRKVRCCRVREKRDA